MPLLRYTPPDTTWAGFKRMLRAAAISLCWNVRSPRVLQPIPARGVTPGIPDR